MFVVSEETGGNFCDQGPHASPSTVTVNDVRQGGPNVGTVEMRIHTPCEDSNLN